MKGLRNNYILATMRALKQRISRRFDNPPSKIPVPLSLEILMPMLLMLAHAKSATKAVLQQKGINVLPCDFYSNTPSVADIQTSFEYETATSAPYLSARVFQPQTMLRFVDEIGVYAAEFNPARDEAAETGTSFYWTNSQFSRSDALVYYCVLRYYKPKIIVEVGGGFSTLIAQMALKKNGCGRLICIDPYPNPCIEHLPDVELIATKVQTIPLSSFHNWLTSENDFLFIDSTHTVKTGSDCLHLYLRILPFLRHRTLIHAHDIFLPFGLPKEWLLDKQIFWTEQYLLLAMLLGNPCLRLLYGSAYLYHFHNDVLQHMMQGRYSTEGGSVWMEFDPSKSPHSNEINDLNCQP